MVKKEDYALLFGLMLGCMGLQTPAFAANQPLVGHSQMHFLGELVNAPCTVALRSLHQVVVMGQIKDNSLHSVGAWADPTAFQIHLEDCNPSVRKTASIAFTGTPDPVDPQVFKVGFGREPAENVGLGIFDDKGNLLTPDSSPLSYEPLNEGETILYYTAKYRATGNSVKPGDASAAVNFYVLYQ